MPNPADVLANRRATATEEVSGELRVGRVAFPVPAAVDDPAFVVLDDFGTDLLWGPCPWSPRMVDEATVLLPAEGDKALVATFPDGSAWLLNWWPYEE